MTTKPPTTHTTTYGAAALAMDVHYPDGARAAAPVALLWHGIGPEERDVLRPLAREVARHGLLVYVPDWRSDAADGGRAHLLESLRFVREHAGAHGGDADRCVLAGWSAGAGAAAGLALRPATSDGWRPTAVVGIAGHYGRPARTTGASPLAESATTSAGPLPVRLVHGTADDIVPAEHTREFAAALRGRGWPVRQVELATDHAGVVMAEFDAERGRCVPARAGHAVAGGRATAEVIAHAAGLALVEGDSVEGGSGAGGSGGEGSAGR
ncbi:alpha/beta hydrolase fold domain-containing protein [Streptomyces buecherae]|uniref:alpha/beta hydrolase fold domain-containing protein n=1 Tax=Streptomyces buecherae TaxID=2763006 RepID=UPI0036464D80